MNINAHDINNWKPKSRPQEMSFIATAAKRQRSEVKLTQLTAEDREKFHQAKLKEVDSWISTETITKVLRHQLPKENIMRCRWILTWKEVDQTPNEKSQQSPKFKPKARLVVLGFEDPEVVPFPEIHLR